MPTTSFYCALSRRETLDLSKLALLSIEKQPRTNIISSHDLNNALTLVLLFL